jgi:hypothetical protein
MYVWRSEGIRNKAEKGKCPIYGEKVDPLYSTILKKFEVQLWSEICIKSQWAHYGNEIAMMKNANV